MGPGRLETTISMEKQNIFESLLKPKGKEETKICSYPKSKNHLQSDPSKLILIFDSRFLQHRSLSTHVFAGVYLLELGELHSFQNTSAYIILLKPKQPYEVGGNYYPYSLNSELLLQGV